MHSAPNAHNIHSPPPPTIRSPSNLLESFLPTPKSFATACSRLKGGLPLGRRQPAGTFWGISCLTLWPKFVAHLPLCETLGQTIMYPVSFSVSSTSHSLIFSRPGGHPAPASRMWLFARLLRASINYHFQKNLNNNCFSIFMM